MPNGGDAGPALADRPRSAEKRGTRSSASAAKAAAGRFGANRVHDLGLIGCPLRHAPAGAVFYYYHHHDRHR